MIARTWTGTVPSNQADGFEDHLQRTGVAESAEVAGNLGTMVLRTETPGAVEFRLLTLWTDMGAVERFAGVDADQAVLYLGDESYGLIPDRRVQHHTVVWLRLPPGDTAPAPWADR